MIERTPRHRFLPGNPPRTAAGRPRGIALMLTLVVVVLLTAYISEFFFTSGLELRAMQTFKDGAHARTLARLAFKAAQVGLLTRETEFFAKYRELKKALDFTAIPWEDGFLVALEIVPQDHLFNLNEMAALRDGKAKDQIRWNLFLNTLKDVNSIPIDEGFDPQPLPQERLAELYGALVDWLDKGNTDYRGVAGALGAEEDAYFNDDPQFRPKNGRLDRLSEIRLVRGVKESRLPWKDWRDNFTALPKSTSGALYPEKLNINMASREEIKDFLAKHQYDGVDSEWGSVERGAQEGFNKYAHNADAIANLVVPEEGTRTLFDKASLQTVLREIPDLSSTKISDKIFAYASEYFRVNLTMNVNEVDSHLRALVRVIRTPMGVGQEVQVLRFVLN